MRLWTVHPRHLDTAGLVALWREGLLAQKVLKGETRGYRHHPQLSRFKAVADPLGAIATYLRTVQEEAAGRGFRFDQEKIAAAGYNARIACTRGQLLYEWRHLLEKVRRRDSVKYGELIELEEPRAHPLFRLVEGEIEDWEVIK
jgi:Pyrimidine dimer DNA glycosylase